MSYPTEDAAFFAWVKARQDFVPKVVKFSLSSAEILAMDVTPVLVVPGVPGKVLTFVGGAAIYRAGTTPYMVAVGDAFVFGSLSTIFSSTGAWYADKFITEPTDQTAQMSMTMAASGTIAGDQTGQGLYLWLTDTATAGDGTVDLILQYIEVEF